MSNPLQNKTLEMILGELVEWYGWETLGQDIKIKCFTTDPSIKSSLKFLRKTPWARQKVEELYIKTVREIERKSNVHETK
ncbi:VF530 family protein [uncultured Agitococcus sp.]|uniref:VF530 family protein n=1 Tax=uncultured Agitococcus sp. TaxID=1506599 RepID=UPI002614EBB9|nr:VF530 family protein [uncultured Agitococcus sp.]